ncbi:TPA: DNA polymerase IV [bacterium]|jgi:DNA polymerase-4|nr:DNA polymerase IV [bacterium]
MKERVILHCDINHCYAQIEEMKFPQLRNVPMAVGGHEESRHGIILAKNLLAKKFKIKTGETLRDAKRKCPELVIVHPNYDDYLYYTEKVKDIYREYTDKVESFGLDEAWVDLSSSSIFGSGEEVAKIIQKRVLEEIGLTISIGVSFNKVFAKLGSDLIKPSGLVVITRENYKETVWPLPVEDLFYVGKATKRKLEVMNINTIGELANTGVEVLRKRFGKMGEVLWGFANGYDLSNVTHIDYQREIKSVGNSVTAIRDIINYEDAKIVFYVLSESVASRLKESGLKGYVVSISLRNNKLEWFTRQQKRDIPTNISKEIMETTLELLKNNYDFSIPLRSIGISVSMLVPDDYPSQMSLFINEEERDKAKRIDETLDKIRNRFGHYSIHRACVLLDSKLTGFSPKEDHIIHPVSYF